MEPNRIWWSVIIIAVIIPIVFWFGSGILGFNPLTDAVLAIGTTFSYFIFITSSDNLANYVKDQSRIKEEVMVVLIPVIIALIIWFFLFAITVDENNTGESKYFNYAYLLLLSSIILSYFILKNNYNFFATDYTERLKKTLKTNKEKQLNKLDSEDSEYDLK